MSRACDVDGGLMHSGHRRKDDLNPQSRWAKIRLHSPEISLNPHKGGAKPQNRSLRRPSLTQINFIDTLISFEPPSSANVNPVARNQTDLMGPVLRQPLASRASGRGVTASPVYCNASGGSDSRVRFSREATAAPRISNSLGKVTFSSSPTPVRRQAPVVSFGIDRDRDGASDTPRVPPTRRNEPLAWYPLTPPWCRPDALPLPDTL